MKRVLQILLVITAALAGLWGATRVHAETVGYVVRIVKPANQDDPLANYFALRTKPSERQTLKIVIQNQKATAQKFTVHVTQAITNANGIIDYSQFKPQLDPSLKVPIRDLFTRTAQTVTVPAQSSKQVALTYQMPDQKLRGWILGGVYVEQAQGKVTKQKRKIMIRDVFAYALSIRLRESAHDVAPNLHLRRVVVGQLNRRNYVLANLQNFEPGVLQNLAIQSHVTARNQSHVLLHLTQTGLGMAPNSNFNDALPWGNVNLRAGDYTLYLTAKAKGHQWHFVKNFTVTPKQLRRLGPTVENPAKTNNWLYLLLGTIIALLLTLIGYLLYRSRRRA